MFILVIDKRYINLSIKLFYVVMIKKSILVLYFDIYKTNFFGNFFIIICVLFFSSISTDNLNTQKV